MSVSYAVETPQVRWSTSSTNPSTSTTHPRSLFTPYSILFSIQPPYPQTMPIEKGESPSSTSVLLPSQTDHISLHAPVSTFPCNPSTQRLVGTKLSVDSKGEKIAYVNGRTVVVSSIVIRPRTKDIVVDLIRIRSNAGQGSSCESFLVRIPYQSVRPRLIGTNRTPPNV
jgi:hypothetical protein